MEELGGRAVAGALAPPRVGMRLEVHLAPAPVGDVRVALGRPEVGVPEHLLYRAEVGSALEQVRRERVAEEMRMDATGLEAGTFGELPQDEECARAGQRAAACVQEEVGTVAAVEVWAAEREIAADGLGGGAPERNEPLLAALSQDADDPLVDRDAALLEPRGFRDPEPGSVEQLHERAIAERARCRADRGLDESLRLRRRERAR